MRHLILLFALLMFATGCFSRTGHRITVRFKETQDTECYLAYHFGNQQYLKDTAYVNRQGVAVFEGEESLDPGIYLVVLSDELNMEVIVDANQHFEIHVDPDDFIGTAEFTGSPDNEVFYEYLNFIREKNRQRQEIEAALQSPDTGQEKRPGLQQELRQMDEEVRELQKKIIADDPEGLLSRVLMVQRDPELPEPPIRADGSYDREAMYNIYTRHFFDNIDFSDQRLLYTPAYHGRLRLFFNNVLAQHPDSIIQAADRVLEKSMASEEVFRYTLWFLTNHAQSSMVMGADAVFVHLVDNYYQTGEASWVDEERLKTLAGRAEELRPLLLGNVAPDIEVYDPAGNPVTLHEVEADYLILYFWESDCPYCKEAYPVLDETVRQLEETDVKVFAVNTEPGSEEWLNALEEYNAFKEYQDNWIHVNDTANTSGFLDKYQIYSIPKIFILDSGKKIRAKQISAEQAGNFIRQDMQERSSQ